MACPRRKQIRNDTRRFAVVMRQLIAVVEIGIEIALGLQAQRFYLWRKSCEPLRRIANLFEGCNSRSAHLFSCFGYQVIDQRIEHALQRFIEDQLGWRIGILGSHRHVEALEELHIPANVIEIENLGFHAVIEISGKVSDLVSEVDDLRLKWRPLIEKILA